MNLFHRFGRRTTVATALTLSAVLAGSLAISAVASGTTIEPQLAEQLRQAIDAQNFKDVLDTVPPDLSSTRSLRTKAEVDKYDLTQAPAGQFDTAVPPQPLHQTPNMDAAVIELDDSGHPTAMADVLLSPQYPHGVVVPLDPEHPATDQVRYRWWDDDEWDRNGGKGTKDVLPGRENAPIDFDSPYPASVLKLMVGFGALRLVDQGELSLDDQYNYQPGTVNPACGQANTETVRQFFDEMITVSKNESACALIKLLHDHHAVDGLNQTFADLGLNTLMLTGTNPSNGGHWIGSNMSGVDTAKLLLMVNGGPGTLWITASGKHITRDVLSKSSRAFFLSALGDQGHNEMLSTTNWCGRNYPAPGIPQLTPQRWTSPADGTMTVNGAVYGQDVRPCNEQAQVSFAHKTGWVDTTGSDAGIVHSLPGKPKRNYIVAVFCNLGTRYIDANRPADPAGIYPVPYTEKYGKLGVSIDKIVTALQSRVS